jgi:ubiquinone/menaquinone biosynthesis C-methylase UbiE
MKIDALKYDRWYQTPKGSYIGSLERKLLADLMRPERRESLLDVGCGTGYFSFHFHQLGLKVTGLDSSEDMFDVARSKIEGKRGIEFISGEATNLPFPDNSFDIVTLITSLGFIKEPHKAIKEAFRVARKKVVIGTLNKYSGWALYRRIEGLFKPTVYKEARFYSLKGLRNLVIPQAKNGKIIWRNILFLPSFPRLWRIEKILSRFKLPLGAFLVLVVEL